MSDWNKPRQTPKPAPKKPTALRGLIAGAAVVLVALGAVYFFMGEEAKKPTRDDTKPRRIKEVTPAPARTNRVEVVEEKGPKYKPNEKGELIYTTEKGRKVTITNKLIIAALNSDTPGVQAPHLKSDPTKPRMFKNDLQGELLGYMTPGRPVELSKDYTDKEVLEMCSQKIEYGFDDPLPLLEKKKVVEDLCKDILEYMKNGGHAKDYFAELQARQNLECETIATVKKDVLDLCREGKMEDAKAALARYNQFLQEKGMLPLSMEGQMKLAARRGKKEGDEE